jgi:hypothetical protein
MFILYFTIIDELLINEIIYDWDEIEWSETGNEIWWIKINIIYKWKNRNKMVFGKC